MSSSRPLFVPIFLQTELERLANVVQVGYNISEDAGEAEYLYLLDQIITRVEESRGEAVAPGTKGEKASTKGSNNGRSNGLSKEEKQLLKKTMAFEEDVAKSIAKADEGLGYQEKINRLNLKFQKEKEHRKALETYIQAQDKKMKVLVDHVEKLMKMIRIESNKRIHLAEDHRRLQKEHAQGQLKAEKQQKIISTQHRAIQELSAGSKILEDQLRLMDEKFVELKSKFDLARDQYQRQLSKTQKQNDEMRVQLRMLTGSRGLPAALSASQQFNPTQTMQTAPPMMTISIPGSPFHQQPQTLSRPSSPKQDASPAVGAGMNLAKRGRDVDKRHNSVDITAMNRATTPVAATPAAARRSSMPSNAGNALGASSGHIEVATQRPFAATAPPNLNGQHNHSGHALLETTGTGSGNQSRPHSANATALKRNASLPPNDPRMTDMRLPSPHQQPPQPQSQQQRPFTAHGGMKHRREDQKHLNRVLGKITKHTGKKGVWNVERLSDLLESCD